MQKEILYTRYEIQARIQVLAKEIATHYKSQPLTLIAVLNGGVIVAADLLRELWEISFQDTYFDSIKASSYGKNTVSSGKPELTKDIRLDVRGQHVLIVEDIVDKGFTLQTVWEHLHHKEPASLEIFTLLAKPQEIRQVFTPVKFVGFEIADVWVEGYGIDTAEGGRGNPNIVRVVQDNS